MPRIRLLAIVIAALAVCALPAAASADADVTVTGFAVTFTPSQSEITKGQSVHWNFAGAGLDHNIVILPKDATFPAQNPGPAGAAFDYASDGSKGATFDKQFSETGTFNYFCSLHYAAMKGTITVRDQSAPPPPPTAPLPPEPIAVASNPAGANTADIITLKGSESGFTKLTTDGLENL